MTTLNDEKLPAWFKPVLTAIAGIPLAIAALFTTMQWYPATYIIDKLADADGTFSLKLAIVLNWAILMIPFIIILAIAAIIIRTIKAEKD